MSLNEISVRNDYDLYCDSLKLRALLPIETLDKLEIGATGSNVFIEGKPYNFSSGDLLMTSIGATGNANGAVVISNVMALAPADVNFGGVVSNTTQTFKGTKTFADGLSFDEAPTSAFVVSKLFNFMYQANFQGINIPSYAGCVKAGTKEIVATNLQSVCSLAFGQYLPGSGTHAAGVINVVFPSTANPGFPGALPTEFVPLVDRKGLITVVDNGVVKIGSFNVDAVGFVTIGTGFDAVGNLLNFTANGANGILDCVGTYF